MTVFLSASAIALAYLIGSIPFGFMTARWVKGIDIRTVGSGNVGATNVGRVLGFKFFVMVMLLDLLKGLLPTLGFPMVVERMTGHPVPSLAVLVALAAILGHNYSVFLGFKGGKGVATSLGAVTALDPISSAAAAVGFLVVFLTTKYVSMSSILGGTCFVIVHFARVEEPFGREDVTMTILIVVLYIMLIVRHRPNLARIAAGEEPKVSFGPRRPKGSARLTVMASVVVLIGLLSVGASFLARARETVVLRVGDVELTSVSRFRTGHQRAGSLTFYDEGRRLAVACPRYNRAVLYRIGEGHRVEVIRELELHGRPFAIRATSDRLFILQRPTGDNRHLEEGYWEAFDFDGRSIGSKFRVGWDPDDLVIRSDERFGFVLTSGHAEGEQGKPDPSLVVVALGHQTEEHRVVGQLLFDGPNDDPERIILSGSGRRAAVVLAGAREVVGIDLSNPEQPESLGRVSLSRREVPYLSPAGEGDEILMPVDSARRTVLMPHVPGRSSPLLVTTLPHGSALEVVDGRDRRSLGQLPLRGPMNLGRIRPTGLAYCADRAMLAVADRSGGVQLIAVRPVPGRDRPTTALATTRRDRGAMSQR